MVSKFPQPIELPPPLRIKDRLVGRDIGFVDHSIVLICAIRINNDFNAERSCFLDQFVGVALVDMLAW